MSYRYHCILEYHINSSINMGTSSPAQKFIAAHLFRSSFPLSHHGSCRMLPDNVIELQAGDETIMVVPIDISHLEGKEVRSNRSNLKLRLKKRLVNVELPLHSGLASTENDKIFEKIIRERCSIQRNGQWYSEFVGLLQRLGICNSYGDALTNCGGRERSANPIPSLGQILRCLEWPLSFPLRRYSGTTTHQQKCTTLLPGHL
mmetsp:Transcript_23259/g.42819  ORF Transcript_23259/g.42819 Transcript_23259/m.42819 type:complete len:203 (+) Transcript_23259:314-922(+)